MPKKSKKKSTKLVSLRTILLIVTIIVVLFVVGSIGTFLTKNKKYDITNTDVFSIDGISGDLVSVKGISLGDDAERVQSKLGKPDVQSLHQPNIVNWEYRESLGLSVTGLTIHMESGIVTRIIVFKPFNEFLKGETKIDHDKDWVYHTFGVPDKTRFEKVYNRAQQIATYETKGLEFVFLGKDLIGFVIAYPI